MRPRRLLRCGQGAGVAGAPRGVRAGAHGVGSGWNPGTPDPGIVFNIRLPRQYHDGEFEQADGGGGDVEGTGLRYNRFRYYDPGVGRYVSADPIGQAGALNVFVYAAANPLRGADPFGLFDLFTSFGDFAGDAYTGYKDLQPNKNEMEDANTKPDDEGGADKYFHCKGHCEACGNGPGGEFASHSIGFGREATDPVAALVKGDGASSDGGMIDVIKHIPSEPGREREGSRSRREG